MVGECYKNNLSVLYLILCNLCGVVDFDGASLPILRS